MPSSAPATTRRPSAPSAGEQARAFEELEQREAREQAWLVAGSRVAVPLADAIAALTYADPHDLTARWITAALAVPCSSGAGFRSCAPPGRARARAATNMDTLIALSTLAASSTRP